MKGLVTSIERESFPSDGDLVRLIIPWLNKELGQEFCFLGQPDMPGYTPVLAEVRGLPKQFDGELVAAGECIAVEHTKLLSIRKQMHAEAEFEGLKRCITLLSNSVPVGNIVTVVIPAGPFLALSPKIREDFEEQAVAKCKIAILEHLRPSHSKADTVFRQVLTGSQSFKIMDIPVSLLSYRMSLKPYAILEVGTTPKLDEAVQVALRNKIEGKKENWRAYKRNGWKTMLLLENVDSQLTRPEDIPLSLQRCFSDSYRALVDYVVLIKNEGRIWCAWLKKGDEVMSELVGIRYVDE